MEGRWKYGIFGENGKPIALLFDENWPFLVAWRFCERMEGRWKYGIFGENGKPIALLFDENWPFLVAWRFLERCNYVGNIAFLAKLVSL